MEKVACIVSMHAQKNTPEYLPMNESRTEVAYYTGYPQPWGGSRGLEDVKHSTLPGPVTPVAVRPSHEDGSVPAVPCSLYQCKAMASTQACRASTTAWSAISNASSAMIKRCGRATVMGVAGACYRHAHRTTRIGSQGKIDQTSRHRGSRAAR